MYDYEPVRQVIKILKAKALNNLDFILYFYIIFNQAKFHLNFTTELIAYMDIYDFVNGDRRYYEEELALYDLLEMGDFDNTYWDDEE